LRRCASAAGAGLAAATALGGCGGSQNILNAHAPQSHDIAILWWWMLVAAAIVFFGAVGLLGIAYLRRGSKGFPLLGEREDIAQGMVLGFGVFIPFVVLVVLFFVSDVYLVKRTGPPPPRAAKLTVEVIGHQWWWEVRYPGTSAITANEIHIPARTPVDVVVTTADVIHSFWVPALNRKIDMIPGRRNRIELYASQTGTYRGQCAQFCGLQHAQMAMDVVSQTRSAFRSWLANMAAPAPTPSAQVRAGEQQFMSDQCASCHRIAGTSADYADIGPDLTHLASRKTLASLIIPNTPKWLAAWIRNPQAIKPGVRMPDLGLNATQVNELVAYLDTLR
jgi:cytochrome c oxidase subunit 2